MILNTIPVTGNGGGGGGGHIIINESGIEMPSEDNLQFTSGLKVTDDNENLSTKVEIDQMPSEDMAEIFSTLPGVMARSIYNSRFNRSDMYDTNEVLIGKWIDGKPLYQKTLITNASSSITSSSWTNVPLASGTAPTDMDFAFVTDSFCPDSDIASETRYRFKNNNGTLQWCAIVSGTLTVSSGTVIVVKYTKTSDSAVYIGDDTDYSTSEKIVGTWIDGSPIWQKTIDLGGLPNNTTKTVAHGITNLDFVVNARGSGYRSTDGLRNFFPDAPGVDIWVDSTNIYVKTNADRSGYKKTYLTLRYTKSDMN